MIPGPGHAMPSFDIVIHAHNALINNKIFLMIGHLIDDQSINLELRSGVVVLALGSLRLAWCTQYQDSQDYTEKPRLQTNGQAKEQNKN